MLIFVLVLIIYYITTTSLKKNEGLTQYNAGDPYTKY